jgi:hypothetical protein
MNQKQHVYCTECVHFRISDEDIPYCKFEDKCDIYDCEDSRPFSERMCYEVRVELLKNAMDEITLLEELNR